MATQNELAKWASIQELYQKMNTVRAKFNVTSKISTSEQLPQVEIPADPSPNLSKASELLTLKNLIEAMNKNHYINPSATISSISTTGDLLKASELNNINTQMDNIYAKCVNDSTNFGFSFGSCETFGFSDCASFGFSADAGFGFSTNLSFGFTTNATFAFSSRATFGFGSFFGFTFSIKYGVCSSNQTYCTRCFHDS